MTRTLAHRVVHGGNRYFETILVTTGTIAELRNLIPLALLLQPFPLKAMNLLFEQWPGMIQVACFDTAFHRTAPKVEQILPPPYSAWKRGFHRYGFHDFSYGYMSHVLPEHLGNGASLYAMQNLQSVATTMDFSALAGLMMGTRTGSLDPSSLALPDGDRKTLAGRSGLHALQPVRPARCFRGFCRTARGGEARGNPGEAGKHARIALALYVRRIVREIGALTAVLGGLDPLVFTAGVGENRAFVRERICRDLSFLGIRLNDAANAVHASITYPDRGVRVDSAPTNEEWIASIEACRLFHSKAS